jgi:hypothetical protein
MRGIAFRQINLTGMTEETLALSALKILEEKMTKLTEDDVGKLASWWYSTDGDEFARNMGIEKSHHSYIDEKFDLFQKNPFRYFGRLDSSNRKKFVDWMNRVLDGEKEA